MKCLLNKETRKPVFVLEIPEHEASCLKNSVVVKKQLVQIDAFILEFVPKVAILARVHNVGVVPIEDLRLPTQADEGWIKEMDMFGRLELGDWDGFMELNWSTERKR